MAKALTYDEVAEKAQSLAQQNINPSIRAVQAELGGRSTDDIARHMKKWHEARSATMHKVWRLPDSVSAAVDLEIERRTQEIEARANEARMQASTQTDELLEEVEQLHAEERMAWAKERVRLQTDAEVGRRDSATALELREQAQQLKLEVQKRTCEGEAKDNRIAELEHSAESADAMRERAYVAETHSKVLRAQLEESKQLLERERGDWLQEQVQLIIDADIGRRDSAENVRLRDTVLLLTSVSQHVLGQVDMLAQRNEALELSASSV